MKIFHLIYQKSIVIDCYCYKIKINLLYSNENENEVDDNNEKNEKNNENNEKNNEKLNYISHKVLETDTLPGLALKYHTK